MCVVTRQALTVGAKGWGCRREVEARLLAGLLAQRVESRDLSAWVTYYPSLTPRPGTALRLSMVGPAPLK
jgi:hypothetical protein